MNHRMPNRYDKKSFSLFYNELARWFFLFMFFAGMFSAYVLGVQFALNYAVNGKIEFTDLIFTTFSILATVWGIMAHREFTRSSTRVNETRDLARQINPQIGKYEYKSYNPETHEFEDGYIPFGPIDFWDPATYAPDWVDKGKYWHVLLGLQVPNKELILQVVKDDDLLNTRNRNVAMTERETVRFPWSENGLSKRFRYRVKIPQWAVIRAEYQGTKSDNQENIVTNREIGKLNRNIVLLVDEIIERERFRLKYPWKITGFWIYLYKSLPIKIIYNEILEKLPGFRKSIVKEANETLADIKEDRLILAILDVAKNRGIDDDKIDKISRLINFLEGVYSDIGLGEGSTVYHNFHHSLEVCYMSLKMLPNSIYDYRFTANDVEIILVGALLHDYDPLQFSYVSSESNPEKRGYPESESQIRPIVGPRVSRTIEIIQRYHIHDAYFKLDAQDLEKLFENFSFKSKSPFSDDQLGISKDIGKSDKSLIVEAIIWRTDFPYFKLETAQVKFKKLLSEIEVKGYDIGKIKVLAEVLWLSDLSVTYMGSDPIRAWNRVTSLYEELYLPKLEAVSRTDSYFSDFAETQLFKELIKMKSFPDIFKYRWNSVYQFFHEGNPSTLLIRTILNARKSFLKINILFGNFTGKIIYKMAKDTWAEFFIGIGEDQNEIYYAKSKFLDLETQNAFVFWGNPAKLLPNIPNNSVDNFIIYVPRSMNFRQLSDASYFGSLINAISSKLNNNGTLQMVTDIPKDGELYNNVYKQFIANGFVDCPPDTKPYFANFDQDSLPYYSKPYISLFCRRQKQ